MSRGSVLSSIDQRTKAGRYMRDVAEDLAKHVGGKPNAVQRIIITAASVKATRLFLLTDRLLSGGEISEGSDHQMLAWLNSMRRDLEVLGLKAHIDDVLPGRRLQALADQKRQGVAA